MVNKVYRDITLEGVVPFTYFHVKFHTPPFDYLSKRYVIIGYIKKQVNVKKFEDRFTVKIPNN